MGHANRKSPQSVAQPVSVDERLKKVEEKELELVNRKKEFDLKEKEIERQKKILSDRIAEYERKLRELCVEIDSGKYQTELERFLTNITNTQKELMRVAEQAATSEFETKKTQMEAETARAKAEKGLEKLNAYKDECRSQAKIDAENEVQEQLDELRHQIELLESDKANIQSKKEDLQTKLYAVQEVFRCSNPQEMVAKQKELEQRVADLERDLEGRPSLLSIQQFEKQLIALLEKNELLEKSIDEAENRKNEREVLELRERLENNEILVYREQQMATEIKSLKALIQAHEANEKHLEDVINDLSKRHNDMSQAFACATRYDADPQLQEDIQSSNPESLSQLVAYMQYRLSIHKNHEGAEDALYYNRRTLSTFLAGLSMSDLTILQGISGTGKSSLAREFATIIVSGDDKYTGQNEHKEENAPYRMCAVQSGWRDNMDLMGFYNAFQNKYNETEVFKGLYLAQTPKYQNTLYFIILDEMNLSHPEHYFADFLSLLENPNKEQRLLTLKDVQEPKDNTQLLRYVKGDKLLIPKNVRFIGTANQDGTTQGFAPKTLDRANVIDLPKANVAEVRKEIKGYKPGKKSFAVSYSWLETQFEGAYRENEKYAKIFVDFLQQTKVNELFAKQNIVSGNRFDKQASHFICSYIACCDSQPEVALAEAADHLITTRLLRKINDNRYDIREAQVVIDFKSEFKTLFIDTFKHDSELADEFLDGEIKYHETAK